MKKYIISLITLVSGVAIQAQEIPDAVRYAQENLNGTARFRAMGGAFGALGGDLSAINVNPAGSVVFANNQIGGTLTSFNNKNESNYFGTNTKQNRGTFDLNQGGVVFIFEDKATNSDWKKLSFAMNYENTNNLDNTFYTRGTNPNNSVANYFLSYANPNGSVGGLNLSTIKDYYYENLNYADQQAYIGILSNVIQPVVQDENNSNYFANTPGGNYYQESTFASTGYNGKLSFNGAASYKDRLYIGLNLNSHFTDYRQSTRFYERTNISNTTAGVNNLAFQNDLYTYGSGFSFNLGAIAKVTDEFRLGLAYQSPTWMQLNDELKQSLISNGQGFIDYSDPVFNAYTTIPGTSSANGDSNITMVYDPYKLRTPSKWTGSAAYIFGKRGLISLDYGIKDYSNIEFAGSDSGTASTNNAISNTLRSTHEVRVGGEYRIKQWSLRAGYRDENSPYKNLSTIGASKSYSGGIGYNFGDTKLDVSYTRLNQNLSPNFFEQGFTAAPSISTNSNNVSLTLLFEL